MLKKLSGLVLFAGLMLWLAPLGQAQFSTPSVNISNSAMDSKFPKICHVPGIATELVAWVETDGTNDYLYFAKSTNGAVTWSTPVQLSTAGQILGHSDDLQDYCAFSMEVADPYVHIVIQWRNDPSDDWDIWYIRSVDLGDTWDIYNDWVALTNNSNASQYPDVATAGDYVHVTYQDDWPGNLEIMYKRITNYGGGSVDQTRRLTFSTGTSYYPKIAVRESGYCVSVVYEDDTSGQYQVYYKHVDDYGAGPYQTKQLTSSTFWNGLPDIAVGTGSYDAYVYIVYQSFWPGNREVMYKRLDNYGYDGFNTYTARLTYSTTESRSNAIDWDTLYDYVHISYQDPWPGNNDIMYRKLSSGGGGGFTGQRVSWGAGDSSSSTVAASGAWAYVAWADDSSGNYEIYVKKGL